MVYCLLEVWNFPYILSILNHIQRDKSPFFIFNIRMPSHILPKFDLFNVGLGEQWIFSFFTFSFFLHALSLFAPHIIFFYEVNIANANAEAHFSPQQYRRHQILPLKTTTTTTPYFTKSLQRRRCVALFRNNSSRSKDPPRSVLPTPMNFNHINFTVHHKLYVHLLLGIFRFFQSKMLLIS